ncbi:hypothetical protein [Spiroplasma endosymbiont of Stenodema calcarata]|uniref:hypothetical protein n=1 Tax=Spiroplasma endosymbiont of Stenodema calcarata TaxID=3139328 RepID=UPI003CCA83D0
MGLKLVNNDSEQNNINILISKPGFTTKLDNFGNLFINYFQYGMSKKENFMKMYLIYLGLSYNSWFSWSFYKLSKSEVRSFKKPDGVRFSDMAKLNLSKFKTWLNKNDKSSEDFDLFSEGLLNNQDQLWYGRDKIDFNNFVYYDISKKDNFGFSFGSNSLNSLKFNFFDHNSNLNGIYFNISG